MSGRDWRAFREAARKRLSSHALFLIALLALFALVALNHDSQSGVARYAQYQAAKGSSHQSASDLAAEITAHYTRLLAFLTAVLAVVGVLQFAGAAAQTYWLYRADKNAKRAADLADTQIALAIRQTDLAEKQHGLERLHYLGAHPPNVVLRDVYFDDMADNALVSDGRGVSFLLVNSGATEARIIESWVLLEWRQPNTKVRNMLSAGHDDLHHPILAGGEPRYFSAEAPPEFSLYEMFGPNITRMSNDTLERSGELHFSGCLLYEDFDGKRYRSVFRRIFDHKRGGFYRTNDPDDEYAN